MTAPETDFSLDTPLDSALVVGLAVTGRAVADAFIRRGHRVVVVDDSPSEAAFLAAADRNIEIVVAPDDEMLATMMRGVDVVVPSPGVPRHHSVFRLADEMEVPVVSELDLAARWDNRPIVAITGTNGKTTVTTLVTAMLRRSGIPALAAGNVDIPLVEAIDRVDVSEVNAADLGWFVVEASSFRLERVQLFRSKVGAWLNLAPDHLDWHPDMGSYASAKARMWSNNSADDVKVVPFDNTAINSYASTAAGLTMTFGIERGDVRVDGDHLVVERDDGTLTRIVAIESLARSLPHDLENAAAAAACALQAGASIEAISKELVAFVGLPHRVAYVGSIDGIDHFDDSKATTPEATIAALRGFNSAVLIAGGRNKGLDLGSLAQVADHLVGVVAIGEAAAMIREVFSELVPVVEAESMEAAVSAANSMGHDIDAVVLSPACASFDWYRSYAERGNDFARIVERRSLEGNS